MGFRLLSYERSPKKESNVSPRSKTDSFRVIDGLGVRQGRAKDHAVRKGVKAFSDALLDLLVDTEETRRYVKDLWGKQELLYLGPDEQVFVFVVHSHQASHPMQNRGHTAGVRRGRFGRFGGPFHL